MFDIWQPRTAQVQTVTDVSGLDLPRVTGITQLNSYYQGVLGAPGTPATQGPSNAVTVAGELNAYLGGTAESLTEATRFPSSRSAIGRQVSPYVSRPQDTFDSFDMFNSDGQNAGGSGEREAEAEEQETSEDDLEVSGLLAPDSPVRSKARAGDWRGLAAWKTRAATDVMRPARELVGECSIAGDMSDYAAAWQRRVAQRHASPPTPDPLPARLVSREICAFMDNCDYSHSADPRTAFGERAEDLPARQVADVVGGFTRFAERPQA